MIGAYRFDSDMVFPVSDPHPIAMGPWVASIILRNAQAEMPISLVFEVAFGA